MVIAKIPKPYLALIILMAVGLVVLLSTEKLFLSFEPFNTASEKQTSTTTSISEEQLQQIALEAKRREGVSTASKNGIVFSDITTKDNTLTYHYYYTDGRQILEPATYKDSAEFRNLRKALSATTCSANHYLIYNYNVKVEYEYKFSNYTALVQVTKEDCQKDYE